MAGVGAAFDGWGWCCVRWLRLRSLAGAVAALAGTGAGITLEYVGVRRVMLEYAISTTNAAPRNTIDKYRKISHPYALYLG